VRHGTAYTYRQGCACKKCRDANTARNAAIRERLQARMAADDPAVPHGTTSGYRNWYCRCEPCVQANAEAIAAYPDRLH
jgi:hypothetical protein